MEHAGTERVVQEESVCDGLGCAWASSRERPRQLRQRVRKDREAGLGQGHRVGSGWGGRKGSS